jgi:hypothetical protein
MRDCIQTAAPRLAPAACPRYGTASAAWLAHLATLPPSSRQLALLRHLGYDGPVPTRQEASALITALEQAGRP